MKPALLYDKLVDNKVRCLLCAHRCVLGEGQLGICRVRKNINAELFSLNYHKVAAINVDPIEKKPLYHFQPASPSFSMATMGCNFTCRFCQNNTLSVIKDENHINGEQISPQQLVDTALKKGAISMSYTYSEPTIYFELMLETAKIAQKEGLKNVMVTNGYMSSQALETISPYMDAANIDLKAFSEEFYQKFCGAHLHPVLDTIKAMKQKGIWIELTTLLIPGLNTDKDQIKELIAFIIEVDSSIPWHVSRFFPQHRMRDLPTTAMDTIYSVLETGKEMGLQFLYGGNITHSKWTNTYCPQCDNLLIERNGYNTLIHRFSQSKCDQCHAPIPGVW